MRYQRALFVTFMLIVFFESLLHSTRGNGFFFGGWGGWISLEFIKFQHIYFFHTCCSTGFLDGIESGIKWGNSDRECP
jgi:hypothetical protein